MTASRGALSLGAKHILARLASQASIPISIALVTLLATFLAGAAPRLLDEIAEDDLRATVTEPLPAQRNLRVERASRPTPGPSDNPFGPIDAQGGHFASTEFPESVSAVVSDDTFVVDSPRFSIDPLPGETAPHPFEMFLTYRHQERIEENSDLVSGRLPESQSPIPVLVGMECPTTVAEIEDLMRRLQEGEPPDEELDCALEQVPLFETAVTSETLTALGLELDQIMLLSPDPDDVLYFGVAGQDLEYKLAMRVSGVVELTDPGLEFWYGDPTLHRPSIEETADFRIIYATGLLAPADFDTFSMATGTASWANTWRYFVDPDSVAVSDIDVLQSDLASLQNEFSVIATRPGDYRVITQLGDLLSAHETQKTQTLAMLSLSIAGLFAVSLAALLLLGVLMTDRQRASVVLTRNRGGSRGQLTISRLYETLALVGIPAVLGYWLAKTLLGHDDLLSYRLVVAMAAAALVIVVVSGAIFYRKRLGPLQSERSTVTKASGRRVLWEVALLIVTIGSILVLRRRGAADTAAGQTGFNSLLMIAPVLIAATGGVLVLRVFPVLVAMAALPARRARGAVGFVALKRVSGRRVSGNLPMVVIVVCITVSALAAVTSNSITRGQEASSWQQVGADFIVEGLRPGVALPASIAIGDLPVDASALARRQTGVSVDAENRSSTVTVVAIESAAYRDLVADAPIDVVFPDDMTDAVLADGTAGSPLPALVSSEWAIENEIDIGDVATVDLGRIDPVIQVMSIETTFPGVEPGTQFVIVDLAEVRQMADIDLPATVAYLRAPVSSSEEIEESVTAAAASGARVTSRYDWLDEITSDPFVAWATVVLGIVFWFAIVFAVAVSVAGLALTAASRRRDLAYLRTMGLAPRQSAWIVFGEQMPGVTVGTFGGVAAGVIASVVLAPMIVLDAFTGGILPAPMIVDWSEIAVIAAFVIGAMAVAVGIFVVVSRRDDVGKALRVGEES